MAITSRAARQTTSHVAYNTPSVVGPGSYLKVDRDPSIHGFAPFQSTTERPGADAHVKTTPGPGAYVTPLENIVGRTPFVPNGVPAGAGAAFASRTDRLPKSEAKRAPGPGNYTLNDEWQRTVDTAAFRNAQPPQTRAPRPPAIGPPSIPNSDQSFGYEETTDGALRMQKPPPGGYTGVSGHKSAGPGEYDPTRASALMHKSAQGPAWGNSRVVRSLYSENKDVPGPGAYVREAELRTKPSPAFLSRTPLNYQKLLDPEKLVPGPGAYAARAGITPKAVPENLQSFGSTQKRLSSDMVGPNERQKAAQPGPGAYNNMHSDFKGSKSAMPGAPAGMPLGTPSAAEASGQGFNSSTVRFQAPSKSNKPGPGQYDELDQYSFVTGLLKKTHGRHGVFGSTTRRFHSLKQDAVPGAGTYNPQSAAVANEERDDGPSSAFASGVQRFSKSAPTRVSTKVGKQKDSVPPPWQYNPRSKNTWGEKKVNARSDDTFGSTVERFPVGEVGGGQRIMAGPGPGQYAPKHPQEGMRKQQTTAQCFNTKEGRFGAAGRGILSGGLNTPGPGQYESSVELSDPLIKRSFNITIG